MVDFFISPPWMHPRLEKKKKRKKKGPMGVVEGLPGYWDEGQQLAWLLCDQCINEGSPKLCVWYRKTGPY
jgi:hypothetical protein